MTRLLCIHVYRCENKTSHVAGNSRKLSIGLCSLTTFYKPIPQAVFRLSLISDVMLKTRVVPKKGH